MSIAASLETMSVDKTFAARLRHHRETAGLSRPALGRLADLSASFVYYLEAGRRRATSEVVIRLSAALGLRGTESRDLLVAAGHDPLTEPIRDSLNRLFEGIPAREREELVQEVRRFVATRRTQIKARQREVASAVLPAAGWQARLLSPRTLERTLLHAAEEVRRAHIRKLVLVVAPDLPESIVQSLRRTFGFTLERVIQEQQLGLGHAILLVREHVQDAPFAVILPDDIDPARNALAHMVKEYRKIRRPMVGVNPEPVMTGVPERRFYGVAYLAGRVDAKNRAYALDRLEEKPLTNREADLASRLIVGRYILTPEVFGVLQATRPNSGTGSYELTDALAEMLEGGNLCAYELNRSLLPLAPIRTLIEKLVDSIKDRTGFEHILELTRTLLTDIGAA